MRLACTSCGAAYLIRQDRAGGPALAVRCRRCGGEVAEVRRAAGPPAAAVAAPAVPPPHPGPWYLAERTGLVGPLEPADLRRRWEEGTIGPDTAVWRAGLADWSPLWSVGDLAEHLATVPRPPRPAAEPPPPAPPAALAPAEPAIDPSGARALAALASEELAALPAQPAGATALGVERAWLVDGLPPDTAGVDPTGFLPLPLPALEPEAAPRPEISGEAQLRARRRRAARVVALGLLGALALGALAATTLIELGF